MATETVNGAELYFEESGDGTPVVFLHGVMMGSRFFVEQQEGLADEYQPIVVDFRGHGRSEKTETGHTLPTYAADIEQFFEARGLDEVILVEWSMGYGTVFVFGSNQQGSETVSYASTSQPLSYN